MNRSIINVPYGIRFLGDWEEFRLDKFPNKCIINKQIPGCGFTEYCLSGPDDIILCSPRIMLIKNKEEQHLGEVYVVHNNMEDLGVDKDLSNSKPILPKFLKKISTEEEIKEKNKETYKKLFTEISNYIDIRKSQNLPYKIIVTYDSYHLVYDILCKLDIMYRFKTVIDEFQSILHDARFKSSTELGFLEYLKQSPTAYFVSATPMLDDYIEMLEEFKDLPYFELDWKTLQPERVLKPNLKVRHMKSISEKACNIIKSYLDSKYEEANIIQKNGDIKKIESKEAILFMNSVNHIISIIKKCELTPNQVNILCADTEENRKKIKSKLGKEWNIGSVPLKGSTHKMFTFCTRTTYLGADFYSTCARTFIFSDSNIECMAVDIAEDLPQILGRQRLDENPWKNCATLYYKTSIKDIPQEEFINRINKKLENTKILIDTFDKSPSEYLATRYEKLAKGFNYKEDYVAVNKICDSFGNYSLIPVKNNLVYVNDIRSYRISQIDYKDRFNVFSGIIKSFGDSVINNEESDKILEDYLDCTTIIGKLKILCESNVSKEIIDSIIDRIPDSDELKSYYKFLGPEKIKASYYNITLIRKEFNKRTYEESDISYSIYNNFNIGDKLLLTDIKRILKNIYDKIGYLSSPKATDLFNYFNLKELKLTITDENGNRKRSKGFEILSVNSKYLTIYNKVKGIGKEGLN